MSDKNKKVFGVWMDSHHAIIVGRTADGDNEFATIGQVKNAGVDGNSNENAGNNQEVTLRHKYFKEITSLMPNIDEIHVTGTGQVQEQLIKYLSEMPQYKNVVSTESTSNKMSDENVVDFIAKHFS